jgi:hypothetical protein
LEVNALSGTEAVRRGDLQFLCRIFRRTFSRKFSASANLNQTMFCKHIFKASTRCCYDTNRRATAEAPPEHTRQTSFHVNGDLDIAASVEVNRTESDFRVHKTFIFNKVACCENLSTS